MHIESAPKNCQRINLGDMHIVPALLLIVKIETKYRDSYFSKSCLHSAWDNTRQSTFVNGLWSCLKKTSSCNCCKLNFFHSKVPSSFFPYLSRNIHRKRKKYCFAYYRKHKLLQLKTQLIFFTFRFYLFFFLLFPLVITLKKYKMSNLFEF